jgi:NADPH-dependent 2,4-dienoyl-CoA reductase/sulfur reductase-like enzyme
LIPSHDVAIVGAGPAGLASSRELARVGIDHRVLERGPDVAHTWANLYDSLVLHTGKHLSALPGMPFPASTPLFPSRKAFVEYLRQYASRFQVPVDTGTDVAAVVRDAGAWTLRTTQGKDLRAGAVIMATGIVANPYVAEIPNRDRFRGAVVHSVDYRRPGTFAGKRVLVVGAGNSAGEISVDLAGAGARVTVAVRSGARVVPLRMLGIPIQYFAVALSRLPRGMQRRIQLAIGRVSEHVRGGPVLPHPVASDCSPVPLIGFHLVDAIQAGAILLREGVEEFTTDGVRFVNGVEEPFDHVILATGFRAALKPLGRLVRLDACGFASRRNRVVSVDQPGLYFVGHNYDTRGGLRNIGQDARLAARLIARSRGVARGHE